MFQRGPSCSSGSLPASDRGYLLAVCSGVLLVLCFPLFDRGVLAWGAIVPLLVALSGGGLLRAFRLGFLTGLVWSVGSLFWVRIYHPLALPLVVVIFSLYPAVAAACIRFLTGKCRVPLAVAVPLVWTAAEYLRSLGSLGFL